MRLERRALEPAAARLAIYKMGQLSTRNEIEDSCASSAKVFEVEARDLLRHARSMHMDDTAKPSTSDRYPRRHPQCAGLRSDRCTG